MAAATNWLLKSGLLALALISGCGASAAEGSRPSTPVDLADPVERIAGLDLLGEALFGALREGRLGALWADGNRLDEILSVPARSRLSVGRGPSSRQLPAGGWGAAWQNHDYAGFCAQGVRLAPTAGALGLTQPRWVVERLLVVAARGHRSSAAWVSGTFVLTDSGWTVLQLDSAEPPRVGHADLELAPCDVQRGI